MKLGKGSGRAREVLGRGHLEHRQLRQERGHEVHEQAPPARRAPLPPPLQRLQETKHRKKVSATARDLRRQKHKYTHLGGQRRRSR
jgi:hypothetical protein